MSKDRVNFTSVKPAEKFDVVVSTAVFHENPEKILDEMFSLTNPGGLIGIIDYDMRGLPRAEFFNLWAGLSEKQERIRLGDEEVYREHTSFGLSDCLRLIGERANPILVAGREQTKNWSRDGKSKYFMYVGQTIN